MSLHWLFSVAFTLCTAFSLVFAALAIIPRSKSGGASLYWGTWSGQQSYQIPDPIHDSFVIEQYKTNARNLAHIC